VTGGLPAQPRPHGGERRGGVRDTLEPLARSRASTCGCRYRYERYCQEAMFRIQARAPRRPARTVARALLLRAAGRDLTLPRWCFVSQILEQRLDRHTELSLEKYVTRSNPACRNHASCANVVTGTPRWTSGCARTRASSRSPRSDDDGWRARGVRGWRGCAPRRLCVRLPSMACGTARVSEWCGDRVVRGSPAAQGRPAAAARCCVLPVS
jgi:hypothetical protein